MKKLTILTIARAEDCVLENIAALASRAVELDADFVLGADGREAKEKLDALKLDADVVLVESHGQVDEVIDSLLPRCQGDYVFRLDSDERLPALTMRWLHQQRFESAEQWKFPRAWRWSDGGYLDAPHFWPDYQVRLSTKAKSGGLRGLHSVPSFGKKVAEAPVPIEHDKLHLFTLAEREQHIRNFDTVQSGAGSNFRHFYAPDSLGPVESADWDGGVRWQVERAFADSAKYPMAQYPEETKACVRWLLANDLLDTVLEIGSLNGGTAAMWCELADFVLSVDLPGGPFGSLDTKSALRRNERLAHDYPGRFAGLLMSSHDRGTHEAVARVLRGRELDTLFIDGDHSYNGCRADFEDYRQRVRQGGAILFHDIVETDFCKSQGVEVYKFWGELKEREPHKCREFKIDHGDFGGIGVYTV